MRCLILVLLAGAAASPALAQHKGHGQAATSPTPSRAPAVTCTPEHAAMGHCTLPALPPAQAPAATCTPEHAAMGHCTLPTPAPSPPPAATCTPEYAAMGHCTPSPAPTSADPDPHVGHGMPAGQPAVLPPLAAPPPEAFAAPAHAADLVFDPAAMAEARAGLSEEHGGLEAYKFLIDQLELSTGEGRENYAWDAQFWYGGDIDKVWLKTEGEGAFGGDFEGAEFQGLWSHAIDPWFDLQAGVRQDRRPGEDRTHLVLGAQGLAPYWFEVEGAIFLSTEGELTARVESEYDLRLTQRLILQPRLEADFSFQDVPELRLGSGISSVQFGARLRYEIHPRSGPAVVAPYVGLQYEQPIGDTADFRRASGEATGGLHFLLGIRTWF